VLADPEAAAASPARSTWLLGGRERASTSRRRFCRGPAPTARAPSGGAAAAASGSAGRTRLHGWSSSDLLASSAIAVVDEALCLALAWRRDTGIVAPLVFRHRADLTAWPTRGPAWSPERRLRRPQWSASC